MLFRSVDPGWVDSLGLSVYEYLDNGIFITGMSCDPGLYEKNLDRIAKVYSRARKDGLTKEELDRAKSKTCARIVLGNERPKGRLFSVGYDWLIRQSFSSVRAELEQIESVKLDDLHDVLQKYPFEKPLTLTVGPKKFG